MHEMAIVQEIVDVVLHQAPGARIKRVVLEIGMLSLVLPDAVRFCFDLCCEDTPMAGATLEIVTIPGLAQCRDCSAHVTLVTPLGLCPCGSSSLEWLAGEELKIKQVELA
jgi:hydrogenase nickel incorporation protein HypA/HybF